jgi:hypothetical protein
MSLKEELRSLFLSTFPKRLCTVRYAVSGVAAEGIHYEYTRL